MMTGASDFCVIMHTTAHIQGFFMRKLEELCCACKRPDYLGHYLSYRHSDEYSSPERSVIESFSLPHSQSTLCCSKNKIPPVKLGALRFSAFGEEANQNVGKRHEARPLWLGERFQDHA